MASPEVIAQKVLNTYWDGRLPVDVEAIAKKIGKVRYVWPETNDVGAVKIGEIFVKDGIPEISVNLFDHVNRQRFTLAHELGHYFIGHVGDGERLQRTDYEGSIDGLSYEEKRKEWEANEFAAALLMPSDSVKSAIEMLEDPNVHRLADFFKVSPQAMEIRLRNLGIIN